VDSPHYLTENAAYYSEFWKTSSRYLNAFPNGEEGTRGGVILSLLASLSEQDDWAQHPPRILDAGCGRGWLTRLASMFGDAEGCEPVPEAVAIARQHFANLQFHALTPGQLRLQPDFAPFDVVISSEVIEHIPTDLQPEFLQDLHGCVRPGGHLILTTPRGELGASSAQLMENWLTEARLRELIVRAGFAPHRLIRACPTGKGLARRILRRLGMAGRADRPSAFDAMLNERSALYQIWHARRTDAHRRTATEPVPADARPLS
jgi:2-polyprenyl-3-methyl-5-hydroxy-6-metoxy-1,4-benzoquinol methylase